MRFAAVLAWFFASALAAHLYPARRVPILLGAALIQLVALHGPLRALCALAIWSTFHAVVTRVASPRLRVAATALFLGALFLAPWFALTMKAPAIVAAILTTTLLGTGFVLRSLLYAYEATAKREQMKGAGFAEYLLYLTAAPFGIVHFQPVGFAALHRGLKSETDLATMNRGITQMALGTAYLLLHYAGRKTGLLLTHVEAVGIVSSLDLLTILAASHVVLLGFFLELAGQVHLAIGMLGAIGFEIPAGFNRPYTSRNILEFWRRWNIYFRDFVMTLAYYPVAVALKRRPLLAVTVGGALAFLLSGAAHALVDHVTSPGELSLRRVGARHILFIVHGSLVIAWMLLEARAARRRRERGESPKSRAGPRAGLSHAACAAFTLTIFALIYLALRRPFTGAPLGTISALFRLPI